MKKISIGIVGFGEFSESYLDIWLNHPLVERVVGAEMIPDRRRHIEETYGICMYESYDELLEKEPELTCIGIYTPRHLHGPMIIRALKLGKHVFSAVPMGITEEEISQVLALVKQTRLTYMMAETCYYFPCAIWCRKAHEEGKFGAFQYGAAQYYHDILDMQAAYLTEGDRWKWMAGIPPMYYSTHSMSMLFSAIDDVPEEVTCFGVEDTVGDGIYGKGNNAWDNPFSNETAILRMKKGGLARINEFRRIGTTRPSSYISAIYGAEGSYEGSGMQHIFTRNARGEKREYSSVDVSEQINAHYYNQLEADPVTKGVKGRTVYHYMTGFSDVHDLSRLPKSLVNIREVAHVNSVEGHNGSHVFLVDDFVRSVVTGKLPPIDPWKAAVYTITGIYAHESAMRGGQTLKLPEFESAPADWPHIDYSDIRYDED
jgi:predicted dehydrogenase